MRAILRVIDLVAAVTAGLISGLILGVAAQHIFKSGFVVGVATLPARPTPTVEIPSAALVLVWALASYWVAMRLFWKAVG